MKKTIFAIVILAALLTACGTPPTAEPAPATVTAPATQAATAIPAEPVHLKIGFQPLLPAAPFFIARDAGYFAEQNLEVEFIQFTSSSEMLPAFITGDLDVFGEAVTAGSLTAVAQGEGFKYVAEKGFINPEAECVDQAILARSDLLKDGFLDEPANVKGLKFALTRATVFEYAIDIQLRTLGLTQADIQNIDMPQQPARLEALQTGAVDLVTFPEPWITRARNSGAADVWEPFTDLVPFAPLSSIIYGPSMTGNPEVGNRFMIAYLKGVAEYNLGKTESNVATIAGYTKLPAEDIQAMCWPSMTPDGYIHTDAWGPYQEWLVEKGYLDAEYDLDTLIDSRYLDFANEAVK